ncbi:MAG: hypothetical protein ACH350_02185 [Parachlamydiaceae bacterium]
MSILKVVFSFIFGLFFLIGLSTIVGYHEKFPDDDSTHQHSRSFFYVSQDSHDSINQENPENRYRQIVNEENYHAFWSRGTFPTVQASIVYHTKKHGFGRTPLKYTTDAVNFYERNRSFRYSTILKDGSPGYRIRKGKQGGIWTKEGKILTYWD